MKMFVCLYAPKPNSIIQHELDDEHSLRAQDAKFNTLAAKFNIEFLIRHISKYTFDITSASDSHLYFFIVANLR